VEHRELILEVDKLKSTAEMVGTMSLSDLRPKLVELEKFLVHGLIPHAIAEDEALYPLIASYIGVPDATKTMSRDHLEVMQLIERLHELVRSLKDERGLREVLYGLYAIVKLHFAKEEVVFLPILEENLTAEMDEAVFHRMELAAHHASGHNHQQK
jgi:iron-sulfur cluster repair protein YtfE (RIC family)